MGYVDACHSVGLADIEMECMTNNIKESSKKKIQVKVKGIWKTFLMQNCTITQLSRAPILIHFLKNLRENFLHSKYFY